jgi:hypothetical protein
MKNQRLMSQSVLLLTSGLLLLLATTTDSLAGRGGGGGGGVSRSSASRSTAAVGPQGGVATSQSRVGSVHTPYSSTTAGAKTGSVTTDKGTTINAGAAGGVHVGPTGRVSAGGEAGVSVNTASGKSYATGSRGGVSTGQAGTVAGGSRGTYASGDRGTYASKEQGRVAVGPAGGVAAEGSRKTVAAGRSYSGDVGLAKYSSGSASYHSAGVSYGTRHYSSTTFRAQASSVRTSYVHYDAFSTSWYRGRTGVWQPTRWAVPNVWAPCSWTTMATWCSFPPTIAPVYVDYGTTVVYRDNYVYVDGSPTVTQASYAEQATAIANVGRTTKVSDEEEWRPLGVFAMVQGEEKSSNLVFQLSINKAGIIRGNSYDGLSDTTLQVYGSVDKKTQRASWTVGERKEVVYETSIANLTKGETSLLVHFGKDKTQQWSLVRLEDPKK